MNILFKADSGKVFEVPFKYEQLNVEETNFEGSTNTKFFKLILNTMLTDLPFKEIIYTLPYLDDFDNLLNHSERLITHNLELTFGVPKLIVNTIDEDNQIHTITFDIMTSQFFISSEEEDRLSTLQNDFQQIFITTETYQIPNLILYRETQSAFEKCTISK
ncbi:hypothetical protein LZ480_10280 [Solibacillus sp. MA9]|uniref:Uncharacterized protein n=1 Tax=Solibacillus palustris TaxID=2908203 RepID=A0ABS9UD69_9BACL|nr:hypothetical protein [Solibacillus sp. MA9]MCH7322278.1 hypothetical protein [Solibacillus sp. MA9]